jgi:hypothetical protein
LNKQPPAALNRAARKVVLEDVGGAEPAVVPLVVGLEERLVVGFGLSSVARADPASQAVSGPPTPRENCGSGCA